VSVPANPNALALAKSLHISDATKRLVFYGKPADKASSLTKTQQDTLKVIDKINRQIKAVKLPADQLAYLMRSRRILIDRFINPVPVTSHDERQQATLRSINRCHKLRKSSELSPSQRQTLEKAYETLTNLYVERQKKWAAKGRTAATIARVDKLLAGELSTAHRATLMRTRQILVRFQKGEQK
jgi:CMP-N-acetylneuraminic acid synthetase